MFKRNKHVLEHKTHSATQHYKTHSIKIEHVKNKDKNGKDLLWGQTMVLVLVLVLLTGTGAPQSGEHLDDRLEKLTGYKLAC